MRLVDGSRGDSFTGSCGGSCGSSFTGMPCMGSEASQSMPFMEGVNETSQ